MIQAPSSSASTLYVRREAVYFGSDQLGIIRIGQDGCQRLGIAKSEINTLSGQRMHAVRRIADKREAQGDRRRQA